MAGWDTVLTTNRSSMPGGGQHRGLPHRGHGQPARARLRPGAGPVGALVRLVVRADRGPPDLGCSSLAMWSMLRCAASMSRTSAGVTSSSRRLPMSSAVLAQDVLLGLGRAPCVIKPPRWSRGSARSVTGSAARRARAGPGWPARRTSGPGASAGGRTHPRPTRRPAVTIAIEKRPSATSISSATSSAVASKNSSTSSANSRTSREPRLVRSDPRLLAGPGERGRGVGGAVVDHVQGQFPAQAHGRPGVVVAGRLRDHDVVARLLHLDERQPRPEVVRHPGVRDVHLARVHLGAVQGAAQAALSCRRTASANHSRVTPGWKPTPA